MATTEHLRPANYMVPLDVAESPAAFHFGTTDVQSSGQLDSGGPKIASESMNITDGAAVGIQWASSGPR